MAGMEISDIDGLEFLKTAKRGSKYDGVFSLMAKLEPGEKKTVLLPLPKGKDPVKARVALNASIVKRGPKPPEGYRWSLRRTDDHKIAIFLREE